MKYLVTVKMDHRPKEEDIQIPLLTMNVKNGHTVTVDIPPEDAQILSRSHGFSVKRKTAEARASRKRSPRKRSIQHVAVSSPITKSTAQEEGGES